MDLLFWVVLYIIFSSMGGKKKTRREEKTEATPWEAESVGGLPESQEALRREILKRIEERRATEAVERGEAPKPVYARPQETPQASQKRTRVYKEVAPAQAAPTVEELVGKMELPSFAAQEQVYRVPVKRLRRPESRYRQLLRSHKGAKDAFAMAEIMGKPKALASD